jgi:hypothetical protein
MGGKRDWLVMSVKWSESPPKPEYLIWYRTNDSGYTADLMHAGRYTEEEARSRESEGITMAVPCQPRSLNPSRLAWLRPK